MLNNDLMNDQTIKVIFLYMEIRKDPKKSLYM